MVNIYFALFLNIQAFFGDKDVISISWRYEEIHEILKRRYALQVKKIFTFILLRMFNVSGFLAILVSLTPDKS